MSISKRTPPVGLRLGNIFFWQSGIGSSEHIVEYAFRNAWNLYCFNFLTGLFFQEMIYFAELRVKRYFEQTVELYILMYAGDRVKRKQFRKVRRKKLKKIRIRKFYEELYRLRMRRKKSRLSRILRARLWYSEKSFIFSFFDNKSLSYLFLNGILFRITKLYAKFSQKRRRQVQKEVQRRKSRLIKRGFKPQVKIPFNYLYAKIFFLRLKGFLESLLTHMFKRCFFIQLHNVCNIFFYLSKLSKGIALKHGKAVEVRILYSMVGRLTYLEGVAVSRGSRFSLGSVVRELVATRLSFLQKRREQFLIDFAGVVTSGCWYRSGQLLLMWLTLAITRLKKHDLVFSQRRLIGSFFRTVKHANFLLNVLIGLRLEIFGKINGKMRAGRAAFVFGDEISKFCVTSKYDYVIGEAYTFGGVINFRLWLSSS